MQKKLTLGCAIELAIAELVKKDIATSLEKGAFKTDVLPFLLPQHRKYLNFHLLGQQFFVMQVL